jgi:lipoyl(octanoyl) transferase
VRDATLLDLGRMDYRAAWDVQKSLAARCAEGGHDTLVFVEHDPVLTLGKNFHAAHLLLARDGYERLGIDVVETDRGGDVTFHGPRQLVIYPVFNVKRLGGDLHRWLRDLEETVIVSLRTWGLEGRRFPPHTGVWIADSKAAAIGVKISRWVSLHGIALNCDNDLTPFGTIVPCGIEGYGVTSISKEAGVEVGIESVKPVIAAAFESVFQVRLQPEARKPSVGRLQL